MFAFNYYSHVNSQSNAIIFVSKGAIKTHNTLFAVKMLIMYSYASIQPHVIGFMFTYTSK